MRKGCMKSNSTRRLSSSHLAMTATAPSLPMSKKREVYWGDIHVYEFPNILGDNPSVSDGAPLSIDWKHTSCNVIGVDYYEYLRQSHPRRRRKDLILSGGARDTYLLGMGYKLNHLIEVADDIKKIRRSRQANMKGSWDKFKAVFEIAVLKSAKKPLPKILAAKSG